MRDKSTAPRFNTYRMLGVERSETGFHSKMLADLLDPAGSHGQGTVFLDDFLTMLRANKDFLEMLHHMGMTFSDDGGSGYFVEREMEKIDINIYKPKVAYIGIENKIDAAEQPNQLWRYWERITSKRDYATRALIFLTPTGAESQTANGARYFRMSYREHILDEWLPRCLSHQLPTKVKGSLMQYKDTIRRMTDMKSVLEHDEIAQFLSTPDKMDLAFEIKRKIECTKTLLQGRFWERMKLRLEDDLRTDSLNVELTKGWEANPAKAYVGCDVRLADTGSKNGSALYLRVLQYGSSAQLFYSVSWPEEKKDFESLSQRAEMQKLIELIRGSEYGSNWQDSDQYQLGLVWRDNRLRDDEVAKKLARSVDNVVSEVVSDFSKFARLCCPHLRTIRF